MSTLLPHARRAFLGLALAAVGTAAWSAEPAFPSKPIRLVVPFPAGGTTDTLARVLAPRLAAKLNGTVLVDNKGGAATQIGTMEVVRSPADGHTLLITGPSTFTANPAVNPQLPYDPIKSFDYIGLTGSMPVILLASTRAPYTSVAAMVAQAKREPGQHFYGAFGAGSIMHFAGESLNAAAGIKLATVPYKGSAPAMTDLIGGQIPLTFDTVVVAAPHVKAEKVRALAVTSAQRSALLPQVPTLAESGYAIDISSWLGIAAPAGLPPAVRKKLETALSEVVSEKSTQDAMLAMGIEPAPVGAAAFRKKVETEFAAFRKLAIDNGIKPDQ